MEKPLLALSALALMALSIPAHAETQGQWYVSGAAGWSIVPDSDFTWSELSTIGSPTTGEFALDNGANFAAAVGAKVNQNLRTEVEVSYRKANIDSVSLDGVGDVETFLAGLGVPVDIGGNVKTWALLLNGYYDFMPESRFHPYLSAGIGLARHNAKLSIGGVSDSASDTKFAYQAGAGASYDLTSQTALFGGYRYLGSSDPNFDGVDAEYDAHEIRVGLRFSF